MANNGGSDKKSFFQGVLHWSQTSGMQYFQTGLEIGRYLYSKLRIIGWCVVTVSIITAAPLIFEIQREGEIEKLEQLQIEQAIASGQTPKELADMGGITSAIAPSVLDKK